MVKKDLVYSLVVINLSDNFPSEFSRIRYYSILKNEYLDLEKTIIESKVSDVLDLLITGLEEKFKYLQCLNRNVISMRLHKTLENDTFFTQPNGFFIPPMSAILQNNVKQPQLPSTNFIVSELSDELSLSDIEAIILRKNT